MLRASAREFVAKECPPAYVRRMMEAADAWDDGLWRKLTEMGWTGLGIPEPYGGIGSFLDLVVVLEEAGRVLLPGPFFSTMALAVPALLEAGTEAQRREGLPPIAAREARPPLALPQPARPWGAHRARPAGGPARGGRAP